MGETPMLQCVRMRDSDDQKPPTLPNGRRLRCGLSIQPISATSDGFEFFRQRKCDQELKLGW
jgi:hypothetical protein